MNEPATSSETTPAAPAAPGAIGTETEGTNLLGWPVVATLVLLVVAILAGAFYFNPLDCLVGGGVIALGIAAMYFGVQFDDADGRAAIGAPVVLFAAVVFFLFGVMIFVGAIELPGLPAPTDSGPEEVPADLRDSQVRLESPIAREPLLASIAWP